ncbi:MAG TPA: alpha/beta hydrolase [Rhizomicrobium sp.]|jgi:acetyl esterase/lipase
MSIKDREALKAFFSQNNALEAGSFAEQRKNFDAMGAMFPVTEGTEVEPATIGGVNGEWVRARRARRDAVLLYLHGGGYAIGSPQSHRSLTAQLSADTGLSVFAPDYRLAPEHPFPAAVDDAVAVYKSLLDSGIDAGNVAIAGDSAGGGLTIATLVAARDQGLPMPACAIAISPWCDLTQSGESHKTRAGRDPIVQQPAIGNMALAYAGSADPKTPLISPLFADLRGLPPLLLQVGSEETLYDDTTRLKARAEEAGVEVSAESWGGMIHVWHIFHAMLSEGRDAVARIGSFVKAHIG